MSPSGDDLRWQLHMLARGSIFLLLLGVGCGQHPTASSESNPLRIVSLTPSLTRMIIDLGLSDAIVGVGSFETRVPAHARIISHHPEIDIESLLALRPTHVFMLRQSAMPGTRLRLLAKKGRFCFQAYPYPVSIDQITLPLIGPLAEDKTVLLGHALSRTKEAQQLAAAIKQQLEQLRDLTATTSRPRVLMAFALDPIMASGPGTVNDELLEIAGGVNAAANATVSAPVYDRESLLAIVPDIILLLMPDAAPLTENDQRLAPLRGLPVPAVEQKCIVLINDPEVLLPGTQLPRIARQFVRAIHPELADQIQPDGLEQAP